MKTLKDFSLAWRKSAMCKEQFAHFGADGVSLNDPLDFLNLPETDREALLGWIKRAIAPRKSVNRRYSSYGLKHLYEEATGNYVTNGQFKGAMITSGYVPVNIDSLNPNYRIANLR